MSQYYCEYLCPYQPYYCRFCSPPPPYSPPPSPPPHPPTSQHLPRIIIIVAFLVGTFIFIGLSALVRKRSSNGNSSRRSTSPVDYDNREDHDQTQNPTDHLQDVGLEESLINSITVCRYKRGGGFLEGSECSICLTEFCEDENLRLLPNCCHAFHLPCIDTWLRSNLNCPLCRTHIVSDPMSSLSRNPSSSSDSEHETNMLNSENQVGLGRNLNNGVGGNQSSANHVETSALGDSTSLDSDRLFRSHSDLGAVEMMDEDDIPVVRRSVSLLTVSSLDNFFPTDSGGSSSTTRGDATGDKKSHLNQLLSLKRNVLKQYPMRSFEGPTVQKRSASFARLGRRQNSILPL